MKLSDGEKLILLMLSELHEKLGVDGEMEPEFVRSAILNDHLWGFAWKYSGIPFDEDETPPIVSEVVDILDMWSFIEWGYESLTEEEKERLKVDAEPFGEDPKFQGFDGNNETEHMSVARFLITELDRFESFKDRALNSHMPSLDMHRRMLEVFLPIRANINRDLSLAQLTEVLRAKIHPDRR